VDPTDPAAYLWTAPPVTVTRAMLGLPPGPLPPAQAEAVALAWAEQDVARHKAANRRPEGNRR
jgi:hypothetical protein